MYIRSTGFNFCIDGKEVNIITGEFNINDNIFNDKYRNFYSLCKWMTLNIHRFFYISTFEMVKLSI